MDKRWKKKMVGLHKHNMLPCLGNENNQIWCSFCFSFFTFSLLHKLENKVQSNLFIGDIDIRDTSVPTVKYELMGKCIHATMLIIDLSYKGQELLFGACLL